MEKINKIAKRIGETEVLNKLTLKEYHDNFNKDYQIFEDDGKTPLAEETMGYMLYSKDAGKHWFVSEKYFNNNLVFKDEVIEYNDLETKFKNIVSYAVNKLIRWGIDENDLEDLFEEYYVNEEEAEAEEEYKDEYELLDFYVKNAKED